jgi:hypothetical protein
MCNNCRDFGPNNCPDITTSNCVSWQGNAVEELEICVGDSLTYVGNIILAKIKDLLKGKGIVLEDLTLDDCDYISDILGVEEKNLLNVLDAYKQAICELKEAQDDITEEVEAFTDIAGYVLGCLSPEDPCGDPLTFKTLIQAIITKLCALNTQFESIAETILDAIEEGAGNFLAGGAITSCGGNGYSVSGTGASTVITFEALVPPYCPILYTGSTAMFDANGIGLPNTPYCGWYLCNGNNGTPNSSTLPQNLAANLVYIIRFT